MSEKSYKEGFRKGYNQLRLKDVLIAKAELMQVLALDSNNRASWGAYRSGRVETRASQAFAIEQIFAKYGIKEVWGAE